jgi:hypothetical protein
MRVLYCTSTLVRSLKCRVTCHVLTAVMTPVEALTAHETMLVCPSPLAHSLSLNTFGQQGNLHLVIKAFPVMTRVRACVYTQEDPFAEFKKVCYFCSQVWCLVCTSS